jgi:hypothetical protein
MACYFDVNVDFAVHVNNDITPHNYFFLDPLLESGTVCPSRWWDAMEGAAALSPLNPSKFAHAESTFPGQEPGGGR